jgi:hypothetical protein
VSAIHERNVWDTSWLLDLSTFFFFGLFFFSLSDRAKRQGRRLGLVVFLCWIVRLLDRSRAPSHFCRSSDTQQHPGALSCFFSNYARNRYSYSRNPQRVKWDIHTFIYIHIILPLQL